MFKGLKMLGVAAAAAVLMAAPAQAATVIDFQGGLAGSGGLITWDGTNLIGTNIPIGAAYIDEAVNGNDGVFVVSGNTTGSGGSGFGRLDFNTSADNNFMTITGCIAQLGIGTGSGSCQPVTLTSGNFTSFTGGANGLTSAFGEDVKNADLLAAVGVPANLPWQFFGFAVTSQTLTAGGAGGKAISVDVRDTVVPEPATMMLLGTGLLAAFRARRKQQA